LNPLCAIWSNGLKVIVMISYQIQPSGTHQILGMVQAPNTCKKGLIVMIKTFDVIVEALRDSKHPFRKTDDQPKKAQKHRYERRKIKEYLHLGEGLIEESA
jgi:hypothetical protein